MALGRFLFKSGDPELQHITLSLEVGTQLSDVSSESIQGHRRRHPQVLLTSRCSRNG